MRVAANPWNARQKEGTSRKALENNEKLQEWCLNNTKRRSGKCLWKNMVWICLPITSGHDGDPATYPLQYMAGNKGSAVKGDILTLSMNQVRRRLHEETILTLNLPELSQALSFQESVFGSAPIFQVEITEVLGFHMKCFLALDCQNYRSYSFRLRPILNFHSFIRIGIFLVAS